MDYTTSDKTWLQNAADVYESLRLKWSKDSSVLNNLAYLLGQKDEKLAEALELARTAAEQNPDEAGYLETYGHLPYRSGQPARAARSPAAAVQRYERDPKRDVSRLGTQTGGRHRWRSMSIWAWCMRHWGNGAKPWMPVLRRIGEQHDHE